MERSINDCTAIFSSDTDGLFTTAISSVVSEYGKTFTWPVKLEMMGRSQTEAIEFMIKQLDLPVTVEECRTKLNLLWIDLFPRAKLLSGAKKLVLHLKKHNIPLAIATGSSKITFDYKTANHKELLQAFHHVVLANDDPEVMNGKPAPDAFLVAARRFEDHPHPEKVLVFEDAVNGVLSSHAAGMQCVWVPSDQIDRRLAQDRATITLNSLEEFRPEEFGLPVYEC